MSATPPLYNTIALVVRPNTTGIGVNDGFRDASKE